MDELLSGGLDVSRSEAGLWIVKAVNPAKLKYAPPPQVTPTVVNVPQGFYSGSFGPAEDVIFNWPASVRFSEFISTGGRHLRIIGGASTKGAGGSAIQVTGCTGSFFGEGLLIDTSAANIDAINVCGDTAATYTKFPDVYIQNTRIIGVNGTNATTHADVFQPQGSIKNLFIDKLTFSSNYQGLSLFQNQAPITSAVMSRVNGFYTAVAGDPVTYLMWLVDIASHAPYIPVTLNDFYMTPRAGQTLNDTVFPVLGQTNLDGLPIGSLTADSYLTMSYPALMNVKGVIRRGPPPSGDYVPAAGVGVGYTSPGYL